MDMYRVLFSAMSLPPQKILGGGGEGKGLLDFDFLLVLNHNNQEAGRGHGWDSGHKWDKGTVHITRCDI